jgi:hypothetical protein
MLQRLTRLCKGVAVGSPIRSVNAGFEHRQKLRSFFVLAELLGQQIGQLSFLVFGQVW